MIIIIRILSVVLFLIMTITVAEYAGHAARSFWFGFIVWLWLGLIYTACMTVITITPDRRRY